MAKQELSIPKLTASIPTEADTYLKLEELRWDGRPVCPHRGVVDQAWHIHPSAELDFPQDPDGHPVSAAGVEVRSAASSSPC